MKEKTMAILMGMMGVLLFLYGIFALVKANEIFSLAKNFVSDWQMFLAMSSLPAFAIGLLLMAVGAMGMTVISKEEQVLLSK